ncbi:hypothetical protein, partial [Alistipes putredinis]|uniref:hypothetical protein n=1 Tax=Alistipes putredinis TaxID=28117 RepID=UPI00243122EC
MSTELLLAIIGITAAPVTSWLASKLTRQKYNTEIARLRAEVAAARADANRKELATRKGRTNDFGSFATEFVLPAACLNGMFSIRTKETQSTVTFRVEEYKRPTFEIAFTPVSEAYRLGDKVVLKGNVKAFNGMMVQDVPLAYTVTRRNPRPGYWSNADKPLLSDTIQ